MPPSEDAVEDTVRQKKIEVYLIKRPRKCANAHEIATELKVHWLTAERELQRMEQEGRLHSEAIGGSKFYFLNGEGEWSARINLSSRRTLFLDTFISPFGERFVRIKETRFTSDKWEPAGSIIVTPEKLNEFVHRLTDISRKIESVQKGVKQ